MDGRVTGRVILAGGSGFVGHALAQFLNANGYEIVRLSRQKNDSKDAETLEWDGETIGPWSSILEGADSVINLSGAPVLLPWTESNKRSILESRVKSTAVIGKAIRQCRAAPRVWINASAVGYYGSRGDEELTESSAAGAGFLAETCLAWEQAQLEVETPGTRKVQIRIGMVLGRDGGAFPELAKVTRRMLGGAQGSGKQWIPWIHIADLNALFLWAIGSDVFGPINGVGPHPTRNGELMAEMRKALHRPWAPPAPAFVLKLVGLLIGKQMDPLLDSTRALPKVALSHGFRFQYPDLKVALRDLIAKA